VRFSNAERLEPGGIAYDRSVHGVAAFILAGGKSSRMGRDKAFLPFEGETLLSRSLRLASSVTEHISIVGDAAKFSGFGRVVPDVYRDRGPLGGIHAALSATEADLNLILAVDLPFLQSHFLEYLIAEAKKCTATVTVPRTGGGFQPLCAVYRREFAVPAETALKQGKNKIDLLFATADLRIITEKELSGSGFSEEMFCNLNTPEELEEARARIKQAGGR
jgi:molybdopterin-guanine dinucleotide biosynthesis protein A